MSPQGISMEERNDEWGEGCYIDGGSCIGCGDCDDAASFADESEPFGCCFPSECCMPGDHFKSECFTAEMAETEYAEQELTDGRTA